MVQTIQKARSIMGNFWYRMDIHKTDPARDVRMYAIISLSRFVSAYDGSAWELIIGRRRIMFGHRSSKRASPPPEIKPRTGTRRYPLQ